MRVRAAMQYPSVDMVNHADAIVRAAAVEYVKPPRRFFPVWTDGEPDTTVRFEVLEIIRGPMPSLLILPGYLSDWDDFNDMGARDRIDGCKEQSGERDHRGTGFDDGHLYISNLSDVISANTPSQT